MKMFVLFTLKKNIVLSMLNANQSWNLKTDDIDKTLNLNVVFL